MAATPRMLPDLAMGLAVHLHAAGRHRLHHARIQDQFYQGHDEGYRPVRSEGRTLNVGRRAATAEARITDAKGRLLAHATTTCLVFEIPKKASWNASDGCWGFLSGIQPRFEERTVMTGCA